MFTISLVSLPARKTNSLFTLLFKECKRLMLSAQLQLNHDVVVNTIAAFPNCSIMGLAQEKCTHAVDIQMVSVLDKHPF
jgi:hypothetical protein